MIDKVILMIVVSYIINDDDDGGGEKETTIKYCNCTNMCFNEDMMTIGLTSTMLTRTMMIL